MLSMNVEKELAIHELRLENLEAVVTEQTKTLKSVEKKITYIGGVIAAIMFLSTPQGETLWKNIIG